jgi:protein involved in polysaccharide export with SLBB domain
MTVLHVIALAGGFDHGLGATSELIQGVREMERLQKARDELKRLLARRARLEAQRDGTEPRSSEQLVALAGEDIAGNLMAVELSNLRIERTAQERQEEQVTTSIQAARDELGALQHRLAQIDVQRDVRNERLEGLNKLMAQGLTTRHGIITIRSELSDLEARRYDYHLAVVQGQTRLALAERARNWLASDSAANIAKAIAATDVEIGEARQTLASAGAVAAIIADSDARMMRSRTSMVPSYEIVRRGANGPAAQTAMETSSLKPGDVLKITIAPLATETRSRQNTSWRTDR